MKITHNKIGQNLNLTDSSKAEKSKQNSPLDAVQNDSKTSQADKIKDLSGKSENEAAKMDLSSRAQDLRQAKDLAMATPDVDFAKVEKFRKLIDEGKYKVDAKAVADRMVEDSLMFAKSGSASND
jgi:negative regulator of flagellin synthesis FlgM